ncbi:hypothetical protein TanjilG_12071 [Lupinus angustifolius]|uniref:DUF4378 domain-containing protein n=1 Tax=Lupinus angustifolius TaxID=3871 RepID=A0A1J7GY02_LUPAN|nr:PREDICTED: uncharacterized protein LOC109356968 [Lupinus angustifolius]XP_019456179.1 PREDICTED: uncharacterized protein LOC109356968 [Lupinus angustifolius]OIW05480.1 hypothetical protein TanjilG_12071 [Lupinus angustifolius]
MESKHETRSIIIRLMGLDEVRPQLRVRNTQKVLSEKYRQKVASIGVRKKRPSRQHDSFTMSNSEKEESVDALKVVKTIRRDEHDNPSKGNGKEKSVHQMLLDDDASYLSDNGKPETLADAIISFNSETSVSSRRMVEQRGNDLKYCSFHSSCKNSHSADGLLEDIFCPIIKRVYPEMKDRKRTSYHMDFRKGSSKSFSKVSEEISTRTEIVANEVVDTASSSFFRMNEASGNSFDMLKPASNVSVNEIQCNSPFLYSNDSSVLHCHGSTYHQLPLISEHGNGARNFSYRSGYSNDKIGRNSRSKVGVNYSIARKVTMARPLCSASVIADNHGTMTNDNLFQKYWGLRKNASVICPTLKSKYQNINRSDCLEDNHMEENCIGLHKLKKRCHGNDLSDQKPMLPQLSRSRPSPTFIDNRTLHGTCLMNDEMKNDKHEDNDMSKQNIASPNLSVDCSVSDAKIEVLGRSHIYPSKPQTESTECRDSDSQNHSSYASTQKDTSGFQDSLGSFEEECEPSPISVLDLAFREDISSSSECSKVVGDGGYDSSEVDDEGFDLNVSSDVDCVDKSVVDFKEKQDLVGLFRAEKSRDFSYVSEILTEVGISNRGLFTYFSTWHSAECPISPSIFEILERKFGEQQLWKRSERRLLFDRINLGLLEILHPCSYIPTREKPVSKRLNPEPRQKIIDEIWALLVAQEKEASKDSADKMIDGEITWTELREDIVVIVKEIVKLLIEELANEMVSLANLRNCVVMCVDSSHV